MAWPMDPEEKVVRDGSRLNKVLLVKLDPATLDPQTKDRAVDGVVAYSAICPHTGCEVVNWSAERQILECPCHNSQYDPKAGARVIAGPSPRSLAALPLGITNGKLTGRAAIRRSTGYSANVTFNSSNRDGCDQSYPAADTERGNKCPIDHIRGVRPQVPP